MPSLLTAASYSAGMCHTQIASPCRLHAATGAVASRHAAPAAGAAWRLATAPVAAWSLHGLAIWVWHMPALYDAAVNSEGIHAVQHAMFVGSAALFWWGLLYGRYGRAGYGAAVFF